MIQKRYKKIFLFCICSIIAIQIHNPPYMVAQDYMINVIKNQIRDQTINIDKVLNILKRPFEDSMFSFNVWIDKNKFNEYIGVYIYKFKSSFRGNINDISWEEYRENDFILRVLNNIEYFKINRIEYFSNLFNPVIKIGASYEEVLELIGPYNFKNPGGIRSNEEYSIGYINYIDRSGIIISFDKMNKVIFVAFLTENLYFGD